MTAQTLALPWGAADTLALTLPARWRLIGDCRPQGLPPLADLGDALAQALAVPRESRPLRELVRAGAKVAVVVDDVSRPTPAHLLVDRILDEVEAGGVNAALVTTVFALGLHRPMTEAEMRRKVGERAFARMRCVNHNAFDESGLTVLGTTSRGTRVALNRIIAEADVRVLVGCVEPHVQAGFGGGFKNVCPGVAAADAIGHNHYLGASPTHFSMIGWQPETNPMRLDIEEFGAFLPGDTFAVNVVLDPQGQPVQVAAGIPGAVHRACIDAARAMYGVAIPAAADIVISDSHPMDINIRQGVKCVANVLFAAKPGGVILSLNRCDLGIDDVALPKRALPPGWLIRGVLALLGARGVHRVAERWLRRIDPENRFFIYFGMQTLRRNRIVIYSPNLARDLNGRRLPVPVEADLAAAIARVDRMFSANVQPTCLVFPLGGISYPILPTEAAA